MASSPRHAPTLARCPLPPSLPASLPPSSHQLQDLAEFPGARWRFYRLRVDRPERDAESSGVRGSLSPRRGALENNCPTNPVVSPNSRRMELRKVPSSSSGSPVLGRDRQRNSDGQESQPLPRIPQCRPYFPTPTVDLIRTRSIRNRSAPLLFQGAAGGAPCLSR